MKNFAGLHPAAQFLFYGVLLSLTLLLEHPASLLLIWLAAILALRPVAEGKLWIGLALLPLFFALPTALLNALFRHYGLHILWYFPSGNALTLEAILDGAQAGFRLGLAMQWLHHLYRTLESDRILYLFSAFPTFSLLLTLVLRYLPRFSAEARSLAALHKLRDRGAKQPLGRRLRRQASLLAALSGWAMESSILTADAMQARGLGLPVKATRYRLYSWRRGDVWAVVTLVLLSGVSLYLGLQGRLPATYNPYLSLPSWTTGDVLYLASAGLIAFLPFLIDLGGSVRWTDRKSVV